jgi:hypothetical protein
MDLIANISTTLKQCSAYADDILTATRTKQSIIHTFQRLKEISVQFGLIINEVLEIYKEKLCHGRH